MCPFMFHFYYENVYFHLHFFLYISRFLIFVLTLSNICFIIIILYLQMLYYLEKYNFYRMYTF